MANKYYKWNTSKYNSTNTAYIVYKDIFNKVTHD